MNRKSEPSPSTGLPLVSSSATELMICVVPMVAMNAGSFITTISAPLMRPTTRPEISASSIAGYIDQPNLEIISATVTALRPQMEPTERSMPQISMTSSSPMDSMAV